MTLTACPCHLFNPQMYQLTEEDSSSINTPSTDVRKGLCVSARFIIETQ